MRIIKYDVIETDSLGKLIEIVNEKMIEGWKPQGGVDTDSYRHSHELRSEEEMAFYYCQALILGDG